MVTGLLGLGGLEIALIISATLLGALVQGAIGFGFGLVLVPVLVLFAPSALPVSVMILALPMSIAMTVVDRRSLDTSGFGWMLLGRASGTAIGVWLLLLISGPSLSVLFGGVIVGVVLISVIGVDAEIRGRTLVVAGTISGVFATTAAIGGAPLALVYQNRPGGELRSTLALVFMVGNLMSLGGLFVTGQTEWAQALLAVMLLIPMLAGLWASRRAAHVLDDRWLRPAVLAFAAISGVLAIARGAYALWTA